MEQCPQMHEWHFLREIYPELVARQGDGSALDVDVHGDLAKLMIFDVDEKIVPEAPAGVVEHSDEYALALFFIQGSICGFAEDADAFVVPQVNFL